MTSSPVLGTAALQLPPVTAQRVHVSPSTCQNLSLFKELMKEYRKLDDSITMRLNRNSAMTRDRERSSGSRSRSQSALKDEACMHFWKELVATWKGRTEIIDYCVKVVDQGMDRRKDNIDDLAKEIRESQMPSMSDRSEAGELEREHRREKALLYSDEVKRNQIHNELAVEKIVRQRSLEAFKTHCRNFSPPQTDQEARKWWDLAQSGR